MKDIIILEYTGIARVRVKAHLCNQETATASFLDAVSKLEEFEIEQAIKHAGKSEQKE